MSDKQRAVQSLQDLGLGRKQAEVYWAREIADMGRQAAANRLGYDSLSSMDSAHQNAKKKVREAAEAIEAIDLDEGRVRSVQDLVETLDGTEQAAHAHQLQAATEQGRALKLDTMGNSHAVVFVADDGSVAVGSKTSGGWVAHAYPDFWTASRTVRNKLAIAEDAQLVDLEDTRLFAAGRFQVHHTFESAG